MLIENPFTPSFGEVPEHLAGRRDVARCFKRVFESSRCRPELTTLFSGARGTGKNHAPFGSFERSGIDGMGVGKRHVPSGDAR